jgi:hypothetical protein
MKTYRKIPNIFEFDNLTRKPIRIAEPFLTLKDIQWVGTEKVDGTNIRVYWDGYRISIAGRTDKAKIPPHLYKYLSDLFLTPEMESLFEQTFGDKEAYIFGEGYGAKIQKNGELYSEAPKFIVFDVTVDGNELSLVNISDVALKLGLSMVDVVFHGTLEEAITYVKQHPNSYLNGGTHEMEGLVLSPLAAKLYDKNGDIIKCKCKWREVKEWNN